MKLRDLLRQGVDVAGQQALLLQQMAEQCLLRKAAHAHGGLRAGRGRFGRLHAAGSRAVPLTCHQPQVQAGAVRRLMRSSSSQAARRSAGVLKSRKSSFRGFLNL
jgi:hypothetical protein